MNHPLAGKPRWLKTAAPWSPGVQTMTARLAAHDLDTICRSANCPNRGECWEAGSAAFLILGPVCTRNCRFCHVPTGRPGPPDAEEPARLARLVRLLELRHVVITSVSRDDLPDGGAGQFAACVRHVRQLLPACRTELLVPDFRDKPGALATVLAATPTILNHNLETVPRLYGRVRPAASYAHSLELLRQAAVLGAAATKSGIMLGLGETRDEVLAVMADLAHAGVTILTLGQYLRPTVDHLPVERYWTPAEFEELATTAKAMGFGRVESHPLARSSYHAAAHAP